ncbi:MAG: hypothetical protein ACK4NO_03700 [Glycocaulis sp.]
MKHLVWAVAASPLLIAATPAPPAPPEPPREAERRVVLIQNGTVEIGDEAGRIVEEALGEGRRGRFVFDFDFDRDAGWSEEHRAALREAMETLRETLATLPGGPEGGFRFEWRDMDGFDREAHRERVRVMVERAREDAAEAGMRARMLGEEAREMGRMARLEGERARGIGLRAGARGMAAGLRAIDEALERGEVYRDGAWRAMTGEERADIEATRQRLVEQMERFRSGHASFLDDDSEGEHRVVVMRREAREGERPRRSARAERRLRIEDRDGRLRIWVDGEELEGDALTSWLNSEEGQRTLRQRPEPPLAGGE